MFGFANFSFNTAKINPLLLKKVSILSNGQIGRVLVSSFNLQKTIQALDRLNLCYSAYPFANCFCVSVKYSDLEYLSREQSVKYIDPCVKVFAEQKQQNIINLPAFTENKFLGEGQTICFIDTGISPHFDFIFPCSRIVKFIDLINHSPFPYDDNGHGTFVAGIACGNGTLNKDYQGFAPKAKIVSIKALANNGTSDSNVILDAMQWIYENHARYKISVVCMSFGADVINGNDPLSRGAEALWKKGLIIVAAAGNSGPEPSTIKSPGNNPNIITVGGFDEDTMQVADFSSRGPTVFGYKPDLVAPAVNVIACSNNQPYSAMSGTSVATPIIAGICADIKSRFPYIKNTQIKKYLLSQCVSLTGDKNIEGAGYLRFL